MKPVTSLAPGTPVVGPAGPLGTIERVTRGGAAILLAPDGQTRYRLSLTQISSVQDVAGQRHATSPLTSADLARYRFTAKGDTVTTSTDAAPLTMPLAEEELTATTQAVQRGVVHLHKSVETQAQQIVVPVTTETAAIERIPAAQFDPAHYTDPTLTIIPLTEERLVLRKETVVTEYVVVRKVATVTPETVTDTVRREVLTITPDPVAADAPPLVTIAGAYDTIDPA